MCQIRHTHRKSSVPDSILKIICHEKRKIKYESNALPQVLLGCPDVFVPLGRATSATYLHNPGQEFPGRWTRPSQEREALSSTFETLLTGSICMSRLLQSDIHNPRSLSN